MGKPEEGQFFGIAISVKLTDQPVVQRLLRFISQVEDNRDGKGRAVPGALRRDALKPSSSSCQCLVRRG